MHNSIIKQVAHCDRNDGSWQNGIAAHLRRTGGSFGRRLFIFFGGLSFIVSIVTYACFNVGMGINELIANILSWIITVMFAFLTNRVWVFQSPTDSVQAFIKQMFVFYSGRVITLVVEEAILLVFITWLGFNSMLIKVIAQVIVIVLNYVISKLVVFKERA